MYVFGATPSIMTLHKLIIYIYLSLYEKKSLKLKFYLKYIYYNLNNIFIIINNLLPNC